MSRTDFRNHLSPQQLEALARVSNALFEHGRVEATTAEEQFFGRTRDRVIGTIDNGQATEALPET